MSSGLLKEVDSDEGELSMEHTTFIPSKAGLTKEVVFHEGGLSKGVLLYFNNEEFSLAQSSNKQSLY